MLENLSGFLPAAALGPVFPLPAVGGTRVGSLWTRWPGSHGYHKLSGLFRAHPAVKAEKRPWFWSVRGCVLSPWQQTGFSRWLDRDGWLYDCRDPSEIIYSVFSVAVFTVPAVLTVTSLPLLPP